MFSYIAIPLFLLAAVGDAFAPVKSGMRSPSTGLHMMFNFGSSIPSNKKICVITGTTSGLGRETLRALLDQGDYYVVCANRNVEKMKKVAEAEGFDKNSYTILECDLGSFESTKKFAAKLKSTVKRPIDALVCNAALYQPAYIAVRCIDTAHQYEFQI
jgi:NAD(P)-dependent dehydrogenase (short-subunit alcohol dehydrogenase family)